MIPDYYFVIFFLKYFWTGALFIQFFLGGGTVFAAELKDPLVGSVTDQSETRVAPREIQYEEKLAPDWKQVWDKARTLSRQKKVGEALVQYELLFAQKGTVDEARWEYTVLAIYMERFPQAEKQLEVLLKNDPESPKYRLAYAEVLLALGKPQRAFPIYQQLHDRLVNDKHSVPAATGLIKVLELQKNYQEMLPLLKKLLKLEPDNPALLKKTLFVLIQLQQHEKATKYLEKLHQLTREDLEVLRLQARLQQQLSEDDKAASTWQLLIALKPDDQDAHERLELYYRKYGNMTMELKHLEFNLSLHPDDDKLLSRAAELNLQLKRTDRALDYYSRYLTVFPDNTAVETKKLEAEKAMAQDLLVLVENKNAQVLWEDLSKITVDRLGVFRAIADLLKQHGKNDLLVDVLVIINQEEPADKRVVRELVLLLLKLNRTDEIMELVPDYDMYINKPVAQGFEKLE